VGRHGKWGERVEGNGNTADTKQYDGKNVSTAAREKGAEVTRKIK